MMKIACLLIALLHFTVVTSQESQAPASGGNNDSGPLSFSFGSMVFFRNNEYRNPITKGYTLTGSHLRPLLLWEPGEGIEVKGGLFISVWSGFDGSPVIKPVFSTSYEVFPGARLTIGSLDGPDKHRMFDPHFENEKIYSDFQEEGFQFVVNKGRIFSDTWINWEIFTFRGDRFREELTFGESFRYFSGEPDDRIRLEFPIQLLVKHWGGDISIYTEPVETQLNLAGGIRLIHGSDNNGKGGTGLEATAFTYIRGRDLSDIVFNDSYALWLRGDHTYGDLFVTAGLWVSNNFHSPNGNRMYGSISNYREGVTLPKRTLLTGSLNYTINKGTGLFSFLQGFDWYFDLRERKFDFSTTLHIRIAERAYGLNRRDQ